MMAAPVYVFDTCILVYLVRGAAGSERFVTQHFHAHTPRPVISLVTVGELQKLARQFGWGDKKLGHLDWWVQQFSVVPVADRAIVSAYAEIAWYSEHRGRRKGQNDYWIAATAQVVGGILLTADRDFDHLVPDFIDCERVEPESFT